MIPCNAASVEACDERLLALLLEPRRVAGGKPPGSALIFNSA